MSRAKKPTPRDPGVLQIRRPFSASVKPGMTPAEVTAAMVVDGVAMNGFMVRRWSEGVVGPEAPTDVTACIEMTAAICDRVKGGDLTDLEGMLAAQAITANAISVELFRRAWSTNVMDHFETYVRLGLRAQNQTRAACETLAAMKMPSVYARQVNLSSGHQQINNNGPVVNGDPARAHLSESPPNKLLEAPIDGERLDGVPAQAASGRDSRVEALDSVYRAAKQGRKNARIAQRLARR
jgi:hypothetical protein